MMTIEEANKINGTEQKPEQPKEVKNEGLDLFEIAKQSNANMSGHDTLTIKGFGTFDVPTKYLVGNVGYRDAKTGKIAVANGINGDKITLKFDRSNSPCTIVETNEGNQVSIKLDTLSMNLQRHATKMPNGK